jgi:hypothetical protein
MVNFILLLHFHFFVHFFFVDDEDPFQMYPLVTENVYLTEPVPAARVINVGQPIRSPPRTPPPSLVIEEDEHENNVDTIQVYTDISQTLYQQDINDDNQYRNFMKFSLNGVENERGRNFTAIKEDEGEDLHADFDIDALSIISRRIPADFSHNLPYSLYFRTNYTHTVKNISFASVRLQPGEERVLFIKNIPNFLLLEFGFSSRFRVN